MNKQLNAQCELHWWNMGKKTLSFKGTLKDLLKKEKISFSKRKDQVSGSFIYRFKNPHGIIFKARGSENNFAHYAKQFIQMEMVRMGDKCTLRVDCDWRPTVTVNH